MKKGRENPGPLFNAVSNCQSLGAFDQFYQEQQNHRPNRCMDDRRQNPSVKHKPYARQDRSGDERAHDADNNIPQQAIAKARYDLSS